MSLSPFMVNGKFITLLNLGFLPESASEMISIKWQFKYLAVFVVSSTLQAQRLRHGAEECTIGALLSMPSSTSHLYKSYPSGFSVTVLSFHLLRLAQLHLRTFCGFAHAIFATLLPPDLPPQPNPSTSRLFLPSC